MKIFLFLESLHQRLNTFHLLPSPPSNCFFFFSVSPLRAVFRPTLFVLKYLTRLRVRVNTGLTQTICIRKDGCPRRWNYLLYIVIIIIMIFNGEQRTGGDTWTNNDTRSRSGILFSRTAWFLEILIGSQEKRVQINTVVVLLKYFLVSFPDKFCLKIKKKNNKLLKNPVANEQTWYVNIFRRIVNSIKLAFFDFFEINNIACCFSSIVLPNHKKVI